MGRISGTSCAELLARHNFSRRRKAQREKEKMELSELKECHKNALRTLRAFHKENRKAARTRLQMRVREIRQDLFTGVECGNVRAHMCVLFSLMPRALVKKWADEMSAYVLCHHGPVSRERLALSVIAEEQ